MCRVRFVLAPLLLAFAVNSPAGATTTPSPLRYYLALGDSLTVGTHLQDGTQYAGDRRCANPVLDKTGNGGWVCIFFRRLHRHNHSQRLVNLALNGEDSCSFIHLTNCSANVRGVGGGDPPPYNSSTESQLQATLAFLRAHPGAVGPITLEIGANDFLELALTSSPNVTALLTTLQGYLQRYDSIVRQIREAAPHAPLILFDAYNPLSGSNDTAFKSEIPLLDQAVSAVDHVVSAEAIRYHAVFVDLSGPFQNLAPIYVGDDHIHPTALGQRAIAALMWTTYQASLHHVTPATERFRLGALQLSAGAPQRVTVTTQTGNTVTVTIKDGSGTRTLQKRAGRGTAAFSWKPAQSGMVTLSICSKHGASWLCLPAAFSVL